MLRSVLLLLLLGLLAASAQAQDAETLTQRGMQALQAGDNRAAAQALQAAVAQEPSPKRLLNLAIAQTGLGRPDQAQASYLRYLAVVDRQANGATAVAVEAELRRLASANGQIQLKLDPPDARVMIDGRQTVVHEGVVLVTPGQRRFSVSAAGYQSYGQTMGVGAGRFELQVRLVHDAPPPQAVAAAAAPATPATPTPAANGELSAPLATPPAPVAQTSDSAADEPQTDAAAAGADTADEPKCLAGELCIGPSLTLGGLNWLGAGLVVTYGKYMGLGADFSIFPKSRIGGLDFRSWMVNAQLRVYPFGNAFFVSAVFAWQRFDAADANVVSSLEFPNLGLGVGFHFRHGLFIGVDGSLLFPLGPKDVTTEGNSLVASESERELQKLADQLVVWGQINLIRVGYLF